MLGAITGRQAGRQTSRQGGKQTSSPPASSHENGMFETHSQAGVNCCLPYGQVHGQSCMACVACTPARSGQSCLCKSAVPLNWGVIHDFFNNRQTYDRTDSEQTSGWPARQPVRQQTDQCTEGCQQTDRQPAGQPAIQADTQTERSTDD